MPDYVYRVIGSSEILLLSYLRSCDGDTGINVGEVLLHIIEHQRDSGFDLLKIQCVLGYYGLANYVCQYPRGDGLRIRNVTLVGVVRTEHKADHLAATRLLNNVTICLTTMLYVCQKHRNRSNMSRTAVDYTH